MGPVGGIGPGERPPGNPWGAGGAWPASRQAHRAYWPGGATPLESLGRRWRLAGKPAGPLRVLAWGSDSPGIPGAPVAPGRQAGRPIARIGLGERLPWNPWGAGGAWPASRQAPLRVLAWGSDSPGIPGAPVAPGRQAGRPHCAYWPGGATPLESLG